MVETLLVVVVLIATILLGIYAVTGFVFCSLYNISTKFRRHVNAMMNNPRGEEV